MKTQADEGLGRHVSLFPPTFPDPHIYVRNGALWSFPTRIPVSIPIALRRRRDLFDQQRQQKCLAERFDRYSLLSSTTHVCCVIHSVKLQVWNQRTTSDHLKIEFMENAMILTFLEPPWLTSDTRIHPPQSVSWTCCRHGCTGPDTT